MRPSTFPNDHPALNTPLVWHPGFEPLTNGYRIVYFRREFDVSTRACRCAVWVSAAQRFILYLDGKVVARGPSRSDSSRWYCREVVLPELGSGPHVLAATVFHIGRFAGKGQLGPEPFFLVANRKREIDEPDFQTGDQWRCMADASRRPIAKHDFGGRSVHYAVGAGEHIDGEKYPWGWRAAGFDDSSWDPAKIVCRSLFNTWGNMRNGMELLPEPIPPMEERPITVKRITGAEPRLRHGIEGWVAGETPLRIPPSTDTTFVLDAGELTNAYPRLWVSEGKGASIRLVSVEAPRRKDDFQKADRDRVEGMELYGHCDCLLPEGGAVREYETIWFRSFRYLVIKVSTAEQPLVLEKFEASFTGYPLHPKAEFVTRGVKSGSYRLMEEVGLRTQRLCSHETFFDCPHYEQAQFPGDARIQALFHYVVADDDRLARKAIADFAAARTASGLTLSHFPATSLQVIPTWSLHFVGMLYDFLRYRGDTDFLRLHLNRAREVLEWFERRVRRDGMLGPIEYAPFTDWVDGWKSGNAPQESAGGSAILTFLFAQACRWMSALEGACGYSGLVSRWNSLADSLVRAAAARCYHEKRGMVADTSEKNTFSVHAQVEAVLAGGLPDRSAGDALRRALQTPDVTQPATLYYFFHVTQALKRVGLREEVLSLFETWEKLLEGSGLTTWPERILTPRSDCHGWAVTPSIEFLQTVLGVEPADQAIGFDRIRLQPELGELDSASGSVPTPRGTVRVHINKKTNGNYTVELNTPVAAYIPSLRRTLEPGDHVIEILP
ncbi:MAG: Bacterial alpha-L-rhamnosidase [Chitinivibrionales bacterium]|nr:Bacterial alpha-L-rhamnosidase [Chitinivibrionales bacterium]MBD3355582.1 Bacterial alpha-L-rhamnosidase [Chitinivibrionales bacterium]